ncbi:hypothetical protein EYF80_043528 [Liparis tanakae]|uniref:Uncharacterized protein n=1 Tax=Liparis tanakae TaxID=230148 RepID=A0A4Z2FZI0_9TELE|nr:hypothetical protein EYF80_043528 [Liparis tanakae]
MKSGPRPTLRGVPPASETVILTSTTSPVEMNPSAASPTSPASRPRDSDRFDLAEWSTEVEAIFPRPPTPANNAQPGAMSAFKSLKSHVLINEPTEGDGGPALNQDECVAVIFFFFAPITASLAFSHPRSSIPVQLDDVGSERHIVHEGGRVFFLNRRKAKQLSSNYVNLGIHPGSRFSGHLADDWPNRLPIKLLSEKRGNVFSIVLI